MVGIVYIALATLSFVNALVGVPGPIMGADMMLSALAWGVALLALLFVCLSISVPGHIANGERYKSVFDLYRSQLKLQEPTDKERDFWNRLSDQLQYGIDDRNDSASSPASAAQDEKGAEPTPDLILDAYVGASVKAPAWGRVASDNRTLPLAIAIGR